MALRFPLADHTTFHYLGITVYGIAVWLLEQQPYLTLRFPLPMSQAVSGHASTKLKYQYQMSGNEWK